MIDSGLPPIHPGGFLSEILSKKLGRAPQRPYSGKLMLRVPPEIHAAVAVAAEVSGKSINQWATETLTEAVRA